MHTWVLPLHLPNKLTVSHKTRGLSHPAPIVICQGSPKTCGTPSSTVPRQVWEKGPGILSPGPNPGTLGPPPRSRYRTLMGLQAGLRHLPIPIGRGSRSGCQGGQGEVHRLPRKMSWPQHLCQNPEEQLRRAERTPATPHTHQIKATLKRQFLDFINLELCHTSPRGWSPGTVSRIEVRQVQPLAAWHSWAKGSEGTKVQMLALQVWLASSLAQRETRPAAVGTRGLLAEGLPCGRARPVQVTFLPKRRLGAVSDSGQELLCPPLIQVDGHEVCGQSRRLGSDVASQPVSISPLELTTVPSLRPQMWQATVKMWVRFKPPQVQAPSAVPWD